MNNEPIQGRGKGEQDQTIAELTHMVNSNMHRKWEQILRLHIRTKPRWIPFYIWRRLLSFVLMQSVQFKETP